MLTIKGMGGLNVLSVEVKKSVLLGSGMRSMIIHLNAAGLVIMVDHTLMSVRRKTMSDDELNKMRGVLSTDGEAVLSILYVITVVGTMVAGLVYLFD